MNRDYDESLLLGYVEDELSADERAQVERWMADDSRLAALLRGMADDRQAVRDLPEPAPPEWVMDDVDRGLERTMLLDSPVADINGDDVAQRHTVRRVYFGLAAAASVLLAAGVVIWSITGPNSNPVTLDREMAMDDPPAPTEPTPESAEATDALDGVAMKGRREADAIDPEQHDATAGDIAASNAAGQDAEPASEPAPGNDRFDSLGLKGAAPAEQADADAPLDDKLVVVMQTRDVARSVRQLRFVIDNIAEAQVEPLDETSNEILLRDRRVDGVGMLEVASAGEAEVDTDAARRSAAEVVAAPRLGEADETDAEPTPQAAPAVPPADDVEAARRQGPRLRRDMDEQTDAQAGQSAATAAPAQQRYAYNLFVPADQVDRALELLKDHQGIGEDAADAETLYQRVELNRGVPATYREQVGWRFDDADVDAHANARRNWPRRAPDYGDILRQQLPLEPREVAEQRRRAEQIMIPVIIEARTDEPAD